MTEYAEMLKKYSDLGAELTSEEELEVNRKAEKLLSYSMDFSTLMSELTSWETMEVESLIEWVKIKLACSKEFQDFNLADVLESLVLRCIAKHVEDGNVPALEKLGKLIEDLDTGGYIDKADLEAELNFPLCNPAVSLCLEQIGLMDIASQLDVPWKNNEKQIKGFLSMLLKCVVNGEGKEITRTIARVAFTKEEPELRRKRATVILEKLTANLLECVRTKDHVDLGWLGSLQLPDLVSLDFKIFIISLMMRHRPDIKISDAFKSHENFRSSMSTSEGVGSLAYGVLHEGGVSAEQLSGLVRRVIHRNEVNWAAMLTVVTVGLGCIPALDRTLAQDLNSMLKESIRSSNREAFLAGILIARHACLESSTMFPSYSDWFSRTICEEGSVVSGPADLEFLYGELTALVPQEPESALRAQIHHHPKVQGKMKILVEDYRQLARTQLLDSTRSSMVKTPSVLSLAVIRQAQGLISEWKETNKIPSHLIEASMFKRPFFLSQLLPALMVANAEGAELFQAQGDLVELLNKKGKIPSDIYREYLSGEIQKKFGPEANTQAVQNMSSTSSGLTLENLEENLTVLQNLPLDFTVEMDTCLDTVKQICVSLLSTENQQLDFFNLDQFRPTEQAVQIISKISRCYSALNHTEVKERLVNLVTSINPLCSLAIRMILIDCLEDDHLPLLSSVLSTNPNLKLRTGDRVALQDFIGSEYHEMSSQAELQNLVRIGGMIDTQDKKPFKRWQEFDLLNQLIDWIKLKNNLQIKELTLDEFSGVLSVHSRIKKSPMTRSEQDFLYTSLLENTFADEEKLFSAAMDSILKSKCEGCDTSLLLVLRKFNADLLITLAKRKMQRPQHAERFISIFEDTDFTESNQTKSLVDIAVMSKSPEDLFFPSSVCKVMNCIEPDLLTASLRFTLASLDSAGLLRYEWSRRLKDLYPEVYKWQKYADTSNSDQPASLIKVGLLRLADLIRKDNVDLLNVPLRSTRFNHVITKLKSLCHNLPAAEERKLMEPVKDWFPGLLENSLSLIVQLTMVRCFLGELQCSTELILCTILPAVCTLAYQGILSSPEKGLLVNTVITKLKTFSDASIRHQLTKKRPEHVDSDIMHVLNQCYNL